MKERERERDTNRQRYTIVSSLQKGACIACGMTSTCLHTIGCTDKRGCQIWFFIVEFSFSTSLIHVAFAY